MPRRQRDTPPEDPDLAAERAIDEALASADCDDEDSALRLELMTVARLRGKAEAGESWVAAEKLHREERGIAAVIRAIRAAQREQAPASEEEVIALAVAELRALPPAVRSRILEGVGRTVH